MERRLSATRVTKTALVSVLTLASAAAAQSRSYGLQEQIYSARDKVLPALVHIQPVISDYRTGKLVKQSVVGSGIVIHKDGYVVTNFHVAGKADHILCTMSNKEQIKATLIGGDPPTDLAVIKLDLSEYSGKLVVSEFADSDSLQVGQQVMALGSPLALARSITFGVISTRDRYFPDDTRLPTGERTGQYNLWLQTDAAINPGNSGGPLVDLNGHIIGINSRATIFANNIGFSIPSNIVRQVTTELIRSGKVVRSWIGIHCQPLQDLEDWFGSGGLNGVLISSIDPDSPADQARLRAGDIIQSINDVAVSARFVEQIPDVYRTIAEYAPGTELNFEVRRNDEMFNVLVRTVELGELQGEDLECPIWGFAVKAITQQMALDYHLTSLKGVYVSGVKRSGPAFAGGLRSGDVIMAVDEVTIDDLAAFSIVYQERKEKVESGTLFTVRRGGATRYAVVKKEMNNHDREDEDDSQGR